MPDITVIIWLDNHKIQNATWRKNSPNCPCRMICVTVQITLVAIQTVLTWAEHWEWGVWIQPLPEPFPDSFLLRIKLLPTGSLWPMARLNWQNKSCPGEVKGKTNLRVHWHGMLIICVGYHRETWEERDGRMVWEGKGWRSNQAII